MEKASRKVRRICTMYAVAMILAAATFTTGCATAEKADIQPVSSTADSTVGFTSGNPIINVQKNNVIESGGVEAMLQVLMGTGDHAQSVTKLAAMEQGDRDKVLNTLTKSFHALFANSNATNNTISVGSSAGSLAVSQGQTADLTGAAQGDTTQTPTVDVKPTLSAAVGPGASSNATGGEGTTGGGSSEGGAQPAPVPVPAPTPAPSPTSDPSGNSGEVDDEIEIVARVLGITVVEVQKLLEFARQKRLARVNR